MREFLERLDKADQLKEIRNLIDSVLADVRSGQSKADERRGFLRSLAFNPALAASQSTAQALDYLFTRIAADEWVELFGPAVEKETIVPSMVTCEVLELVIPPASFPEFP